MTARRDVEEFLFAEAELLDRWRLTEWEQLFTADGTYLIAPLGVEDAEAADPDTMLFLVADDRTRIGQRVARLLKKGAHVEYPHSRTRRMIGNVVVQSEGGDTVRAAANFITYRARNREIARYMGRIYYTLARTDGGFAIREKRVSLDVEFLAPPGSLSIIL